MPNNAQCSHWTLGVCDASCEMLCLHDVLQFFETSLKHHIVKNTSFKTSHRYAKSAMFLMMFEVSEWADYSFSNARVKQANLMFKKNISAGLKN